MVLIARLAVLASALLLSLPVRAAPLSDLDDALSSLRKILDSAPNATDCAAASLLVQTVDAHLLSSPTLAPVLREPSAPITQLLRPFVEAFTALRSDAAPPKCPAIPFESVHLRLERLAASLDESLDAAFRAPALVMSGGVSFGSYQAGFVAALTRHLRGVETQLGQSLRGLATLGRYADRSLSFQVAAGASAGSINALLAPMESCQRDLPPIAGSTLFRAWVEVGLERLFRKDKVTALSLFDRTVVETAATLARATFEDASAWRPDCHFHFGATTTRLEPRFVRVGGTDLPKLTEKFRVSIGATEPRVAWLAEAPFWAGAAPDFASVTQVLLASASFPFAFAPVVMDYSVGGDSFRRAQMLDGGALNNNPLDVVRSIERAREGPSRSAQYVFFDQDLTESPQPVPGPHASRTLMEAYGPLLGWIGGTTGTLQFVAPLESDPGLIDRVETPRRALASPSEYVSAMSGFFERDFRAFDFYRGFTDGAAWAADHELVGRLLSAHGVTLAALDDPSPGLRCVRSGDAASSACAAYLRDALDPATLVCAASPDAASPACVAARSEADRLGEPASRLVPPCLDSRDPNSAACVAYRDWHRKQPTARVFASGTEGENPANVVALLVATRDLTNRRIDACQGNRAITPECAALYDRLDPFADALSKARVPTAPSLGYRFRDLGELRGEASTAEFKLAVRGLFSDAVSALATRQAVPDAPVLGQDQALLVHTLAEFALDQLIVRRPRPFTWGLLAGQSLEAYALLRAPFLPEQLAADVGFRAAFRYSWNNWWVPEGAGATGARNRHDLSLIPSVMLGVPLPGHALRLEIVTGLNFRRGLPEGFPDGKYGHYLGFESGLNFVLLDRIELAYRFLTNLAWTPTDAIEWDTPGDTWIRTRTGESFVNLRQHVSFGARF